MPHLYKDIEGWFTYNILYDEMVDKYKKPYDDDPSYFVEVGCWFGQSSVYLLEKIREQGAFGNIVVHFVDTWLGGKGEPEEQLVKYKGKDYVFKQFVSNVNIVEKVWKNIVREDSVVAAESYLDGVFDFIFIDAGHQQWQCYDDLRSWYPKLKNGGTIAGHDIDYPDVRRSVERFCKENNLTFTEMGCPIHCWRIDK